MEHDVWRAVGFVDGALNEVLFGLPEMLGASLGDVLLDPTDDTMQQAFQSGHEVGGWAGFVGSMAFAGGVVVRAGIAVTRSVARSGVRGTMQAARQGASRAVREGAGMALRGAGRAMQSLRHAGALARQGAAAGARILRNADAAAGSALCAIKRIANKRAVCFVAGTGVWALASGMSVAEANEALADGAALEDVAEQRPIEELEEGDYVLSQPEADPDGKLTFERIAETFENTANELTWLELRDLETGKVETLGTAAHPFWVTDTGSADALVPLADVGSEHLAGNGTYATSLAQVTDREIGAADVQDGWVLTLADGRRVVVRSAE